MLNNRLWVAAAVVLSYACAPVAASTTFADGVGHATGPLVAIGIAATYLQGGEHAKAQAARVADAAILAVGAAELLKPNLKVSDNGYTHSFPSGHTAIAFASAATLASLHHKHKWLFYGGAALIGWSRVQSEAHSWKDVLAGTALGVGMGHWSVQAHDGLLFGRVYKF
jgi:membrane-associated phospholipid phosphatase